jgi:hypothetical protein
MPRKTRTSDEVNEYRHIATGDTLGAYVGSEQDKVLARDTDYESVSKRTPAPEESTPEGEPDPTPQTGKSRSDGGRIHESDLEGKTREDLDKIASEAGVENPEGFPNKTELTKAILKTSHGTPEG